MFRATATPKLLNEPIGLKNAVNEIPGIKEIPNALSKPIIFNKDKLIIKIK